MRDRLIELLNVAVGDSNLTDGEVKIVADYLLANGVVCLPCKVMQTVYYISFGKVYEGICHAITIHDGGIQVHLYDFDGDNASYSAKDVYTSKEQAEQKLKEGKG